MKKEIKKILNSVKVAVETERLSGIQDICCCGKMSKRQLSCGTPSGNYQLQKGTEAPGIAVRSLDGLKEVVSACTRCELSKTRKNVVFGEGNVKAKLMFVGEAPGADEDEQARPFVGRAGQLLTKIIEAMGLKREDVFIANILKCRPPANRNPMPGEIAVCSPYLHKQIELIKPSVICALGKFSAQTLLATETPITALRGNFYEYRGIKLMPTYHPAYLLRNSSGKKDVWEDMKKIAKELGIKIPAQK